MIIENTYTGHGFKQGVQQMEQAFEWLFDDGGYYDLLPRSQQPRLLEDFNATE